EALDRLRRGSCRVSCLLVDEIAVQAELPDERIHLAQREGNGGSALQISAQEAIARRAQLEGGLGRVFDDRRAVLPGQGEYSQDAAHPHLAVASVDLFAQSADVAAGAVGAVEQSLGALRRAARQVALLDAMLAAASAQVLAQEQPGVGVENTHVQ